MHEHANRLPALPVVLLLVLAGSALGAGGDKMTKPDFTQGDTIPEGADHDWNLGATGARGWMYCQTMVTSDARQVYITTVHPGSPADGVLAVGDVILGVQGVPFSYDPRTEIGKALTAAEAGSGELTLLRWRAGETDTVALKLPVLGAYAATAPYGCAKSKRILEQGCAALAKRMADNAYEPNPIPRCLNAMALLASGDEDYLPLVRREAQWAAAFEVGGFSTWYYGYVGMFLAEYVLATGDESVMPGLTRITMESVHGQSIVGSWGHGFAGDDGRLGATA
jgi:hypothetical protein